MRFELFNRAYKKILQRITFSYFFFYVNISYNAENEMCLTKYLPVRIYKITYGTPTCLKYVFNLVLY